MEVFKIKIEDEGKVFIIRPLPNAKNFGQNITSYKLRFCTTKYEWVYRCMCFSLVNGELKIFNFSKEIFKLIFARLFPMNSDKALKVTVALREGFLDNKYEIIEDDKFRFDNTPEKRNFIKNLLMTTELDLLEATKKEELEWGTDINGYPIAVTKKDYNNV